MSLWNALDGGDYRADAPSMFFTRQLEHIKAQSYDVVRAPLRAFDLIPTDSTAGPGAESIVYEQYDQTGMAKIIADYADDLPRSDVKGKQFVARVRSVANSYGYSVQEIRNAQFANRNLEQRKANAAVRAQRELWNRIAFYGDEEYGLQGWLTNPNIPSATVAQNSGGTSTLWADKTADEILKDMNDVANTIVQATNGAEQPDTLVLPIDRYTTVVSTPRSGDSDTTIADYFLQNNPYIDSIEWSNEITEANRTANLDTDPFSGEIMIAYRRDPDAMTLEMPQMFEQFPVQERNLEFVVPCHSRIAGVLIYYPLSQNVAEGI